MSNLTKTFTTQTLDARYVAALEKDSMMLSCIDALDILSLEDWQRATAMYDLEAGTPDGEEYGV
tara:strand:- start:562 stop:753 length:192 start_codon:yes stop_codon:yes gene_type:complete